MKDAEASKVLNVTSENHRKNDYFWLLFLLLLLLLKRHLPDGKTPRQ
jgi:hypothetical protein